MTDRPSDEKLDRILTDLEEQEIERHERHRSVDGVDGVRINSSDRLQAAYAEYYGSWDKSYQAPDAFDAAMDWLFGHREALPPIPTDRIREALVAFLQDDDLYGVVTGAEQWLAETYSDHYDRWDRTPPDLCPTPRERKQMLDRVTRQAAGDGRDQDHMRD